MKDIKRGYCIVTGIEIPFDLTNPITTETKKKTTNENLTASYCHYSGEFSDGETNTKAPVMKKHWKCVRESMSM